MKNGGDIATFRGEHVDECARLLVSIFNGKPWNEHRDLQTVKQELSWALDVPEFIGFVCLSFNEVVGFIIGSYEGQGVDKKFHLIDLGVRADVQGRGIGNRLLKHLENTIEATNTTSIYLTTRKGSPAQSFYEKNGYRVDSGDIALWPKVSMVRNL